MPPLYQLFDARVRSGPDRTAVRDDRGTLTYAGLADRARRLDAVLAARDAGPRIGLYLERTADLVVAIVAATAAGRAYVPLDPHYPAARNRFVVEDSGVDLVVADRPVPPEVAGAVLRIDHLDLEPPHPAPGGSPPVPSEQDPVAYVIHTSGSTGRPKGVEVHQSSVAALVGAMCARHPVTEADVWTLFHSVCFDFSVWEIWGALTSGGTLVVVPTEAVRSPRAIVRLLERERVTVLNVVPSVFRHVASAAGAAGPAPTTVRRVIFGGEPVDTADMRAWLRATATRCEFVNGYGITETTVLAATRTLPEETVLAENGDPGAAATLGDALDGWEMLVLDDDARPVVEGVTGEIWIAGVGLARGYLNQPDLTRRAFPVLALPGRPARRFYRSGDLARRVAGGGLRYAGRADDQVKLNGFRIELGEVETVLRGLTPLRDVAVVLGTARTGARILVAYYVALEAQPETELMRRARDLLPAHMVPGRFVPVPALPLSPSGKTDRRALTAAAQ